jgi:hypothetical protein
VTVAVIGGGGAAYHLEWPSETGRLYTVEESTTLGPGPWVETTVIGAAGTGGVMQADVPLTGAPCFLRVRVAWP